MCPSLPGRVLRLDGRMALVETAGVTRWCNGLMHPDLKAGDRVLLHGGLVFEVVTEEYAREIERAFEELDTLAEAEVTTSDAGLGE